MESIKHSAVAFSVGITAPLPLAAAATGAAYNVGVATGVAVASAPAGTYAMGVNYAAVPAGSITINKNGGTTYYLSGNTWFQPAYGANGVYYQVVSPP